MVKTMKHKEFLKRSKKRNLSLDIELRSVRLYRRVKYLVEDKFKKDISNSDFFTMIFEPVLLNLASDRVKKDYNEDLKKVWVSFLDENKNWSHLHRLEEISEGKIKTVCGCSFTITNQRREYECTGEETLCSKCLEAEE